VAAQQGAGVPASVAATLQRGSLRAALLRVMYDLLAQKAEQRSVNMRASLSRLDAQINPTVDIAIGHRAFLPSVTKWLSLLHDSFETSSDEQATALRSLLSEVGVPVRTSIEDLAQMTRFGATAGKRLSESYRWLVNVLNSFYAARNMNLHRGIFISEVDIALGELAILVSDALFEVWATWYSNGTVNRLDVSYIAKDIAKRYDQIIAHLHSGGSLNEIDVDHLTAPGWSANWLSTT